MELLQLELLGPDIGRAEKDVAERAFLIGMLSLAHIVLGVGQLEAIDQLSLAEELRQAISEFDGIAGSLLKLAQSLEEENVEDAEATLEELGLSREQLQNAQAEAFNWVNAL